MIVFADTSALFALLVRDDFMHIRAKENCENGSPETVSKLCFLIKIRIKRPEGPTVSSQG